MSSVADVITAVEDALLAALTTAVAGTKVRVDSLPGDWDDDMLRRLLTLAPCVLVAFAGGPAKQPGAHQPTIDGQWIVYAVTAHASGQEARRRGNAQSLGAYELLARLIVPALHSLQIADVGTATLVRVENLFTGQVERQGLAVYAAAFSVPMPFRVGVEGLDGLPDFATFAAQYDLPPHDNAAAHQAWLVGDYSSTRPDAQDTVTLPL